MLENNLINEDNTKVGGGMEVSSEIDGVKE
jgi:hypothetical protein